MTVLDELSGFEFEDVMADVFRHLGYENVRKAERVADSGRDIVMEEQADGERRAVVVECKHTGTVGRPVVQKLHSAIATYDFDGPKRGMVATSGAFTTPAQNYVATLRETGDPYPIELLDGEDLRELADDIGLDLYNGRIEILCDETLRPVHPTQGVAAPVQIAFDDVVNLPRDVVPDPETHATFLPMVHLRAHVEAVFETSVGMIHYVDADENVVVRADREGPIIPDGTLQDLVTQNIDQTVELEEERAAATFGGVDSRRFGRTETEYREWTVGQLQERYTTTVQYTGDNNVTYTKQCVPNASDISVQAIRPVYLPRIETTTTLGSYEYPLTYDVAGPSHRTVEDGIHRCVQCGDATDETYTFCANCSSINCTDHIKTERLVGEPVCTGCAVTEQFFFKQKFFYDEENLAQFRREYEAMPLHQRAMENPALVAAAAVGMLVLVLTLLGTMGIV